MRNFLKLCFLLLVFIFSEFAQAASIKLHDIQVHENNNLSCISFNVTQPIKYRVFSLSNPKRIIIDFENTRLSLNLRTIPLSGNRIVRIREGYPKPDTLRIVLDVKENMSYSVNMKKHSLQISINLLSNQKNNIKKNLTALDNISHERKPARFKPIVIVIDPGHGGKDPGAVGQNGTREKDVVMSIAKILATMINAKPNMRAVLTRDGDYYVSLAKRLQMARKYKADLFIAIHADSYFHNRAAGASVYSLSNHGASTVAARWLAQRENHSELDGVDLAGLPDQSIILRSVLLDLAQTATNQASLRCGTNLLASLKEVTKLHYTRVEQAPFMVLKSPDIPSILVETGFISNIHEETRLRNKRHQYKMAFALLEGITNFQKKYLIKEV